VDKFFVRVQTTAYCGVKLFMNVVEYMINTPDPQGPVPPSCLTAVDFSSFSVCS